MSDDKRANLTVIFDFDGTLANTFDLVVRIYNQHAEEFGADTVTAEEFPKLRKMGYKKALKAKNLHWYKLPRVVMLVRREMKQHMGEIEPFDGVKEMLEDLRKQGVSTGILTSNDSGLVQEFLQSHNFPLFDFVVSEKTIFGKDKALKKIMERHQLKKDQIMYVGDEPRDVTSSKKAGIHVIGVTWGFGGPEGMESSKPHEIVTTVSELQEAILEKAHTS